MREIFEKGLAKAVGAEPSGKTRNAKIACNCAAKHISIIFGPLLEVEISKNCRPLWRKAHFEVKMFKNHGVGTLLDVEMKQTDKWENE